MSQAEKTLVLVKQIQKVDLIPTRSEIEAILLEARLIRILQPRYNSRLKDDKSPLYIVITDELYPKVILRRRNELPKEDHSHSSSYRIFGPFLSTYQATLILKRSRRLFPFCTKLHRDGRPCFYTHIGLCPGACISAISPRKYKSQINKLSSLLDGNIMPLRLQIIKQMQRDANHQRFEAASRQRDLLAAFDQLLSHPVKEDFNNSGPQLSIERLAQLHAALAVFDIEIPISHLTRIEAYDISNLRASFQTASMVVFRGGYVDSNEFRHFRLHHPKPDDARLLAQVLKRRWLHPEWAFPNLIVIDGGEPQLLAIQKEFNCTTRLPSKIPFIGLAKGLETVIIPTKTGFHRLNLPPSHGGLLLLRDIRDHAHRFARRLHHKLRSASLVQYNVA